MKQYGLILLLIFLYTSCLNAQENVSRDMVYRSWIKIMSDPSSNIRLIYGDFFEVKDSSIMISHANALQDYSKGNFTTSELYVNQIKTIKVRKKTNIGRGVLIGMGLGVAIGMTAGFIAGDDPPCPPSTNFFDVCVQLSAGHKALGLGSIFGAIGGVAGLLIGSAKITIPINGNLGDYNRQKDRLKGYSIKH